MTIHAHSISWLAILNSFYDGGLGRGGGRGKKGGDFAAVAGAGRGLYRRNEEDGVSVAAADSGGDGGGAIG